MAIHRIQKFSTKRNLELINGQHRFEKTCKKLAYRNGTRRYDRNRKRTERVVRYYLKRYKLSNSSVERFWYLFGTGILIGKGI
jgi:hypothetical protein